MNSSIILSKTLELNGKMETMEILDVPIELRLKADLMIINDKTFTLIQQLQSQNVNINKNAIFE